MLETENTTQKLAVGFGILLLAVGILGFIPPLTPAGLLLGVFAVDLEHNLIHLASGAAALAAGPSTDRASRLFFQVFGVIYGLVAVMGFTMHGNDGTHELLGAVDINMADIFLHVAISLFALVVGFAPRHGHQIPVRHAR
jgi:hypothetical protein